MASHATRNLPRWNNPITTIRFKIFLNRPRNVILHLQFFIRPETRDFRNLIESRESKTQVSTYFRVLFYNTEDIKGVNDYCLTMHVHQTSTYVRGEWKWKQPRIIEDNLNTSQAIIEFLVNRNWFAEVNSCFSRLAKCFAKKKKKKRKMVSEG